ncbi:MAG: sigma-70 family RNA polymerase sigma factor [Okeania sp. SIO2C9]|uniref:RNA polymerase sigma factor n=1 Tax=Okeania sp. SIO2C9 TaxID=2607791 RepID=UPI0013C1B185|nr:sigma-70 family RNA polymerase sigma factor [Okeania sp. SIO2C9]NEQ75341.1 sigma-70 family RNA polymerase sigma factor [Okeania sp. SIO2C9]
MVSSFLKVVSVPTLALNCAEKTEQEFWQQWLKHQDYLYFCCVKWMGGNLTDAEDALSRAMIKAWEKVQKNPTKIDNFKAWLTKLTYNLCVDIHREHIRGANRVDNIEDYTFAEEQELVLVQQRPDSAIEEQEKRIVIRHAIDNLPIRLRETFILHFCQQLSHQEIAEQQNISYDNVCKRISQARKILQKELREYFIGAWWPRR